MIKFCQASKKKQPVGEKGTCSIMFCTISGSASELPDLKIQCELSQFISDSAFSFELMQIFCKSYRWPIFQLWPHPVSRILVSRNTTAPICFILGKEMSATFFVFWKALFSDLQLLTLQIYSKILCPHHLLSLPPSPELMMVLKTGSKIPEKIIKRF